MKHMSAADAKNHFGHLLDIAQRIPVTIDKRGRSVAVLMSLEDFQHYENLEDKVWALEALLTGKEGFLTEAESRKFLDEL